MRSIKFYKNTQKWFFFIFLLLALLLLLLIIFYLTNIHKINQKYYAQSHIENQVTLRKFPYPYRAAMTICSDIDNTESLEEFLEIHKFINTNEMTSMGKGVGLQIGNSFFFYEPPDSALSYFLEDPKVSQNIIRFIRSGYIDTVHSYGKKPDFTRKDAIVALRELNNNNCQIDIWVDHTKTIDNLGDDVTKGKGDHPGSTAYHADLTLDFGIKFAWLGRITMIAGQSVPVTFGNFASIFDSKHPFHSFINISKEFAKNLISVFGNVKYAIHKENDLVKITELDDGQKVYEFIRFDNYWTGVGMGANSKGLAYAISNKTLTQLKKKGGYMIVYTHFGKNDDCSQYICKETQNALKNLSYENNTGNIFVTTTSKLLKYYVNHKYLNWSYKLIKGDANIYIHDIKDPIFGNFLPTIKDLEGITFYVNDKNSVKVFVNNQEIRKLQFNQADYTGKESVTIPLSYLQYPIT